MYLSSRTSGAGLVVLAVLAVACRQPAPPPMPAPAYAPPFGEGFSGERSWRDLEGLAAIGPRVAGTEGGRRAREYISAQLTGMGLEVEQREIRVDLAEGEDPLVVTNVWADIPGESEDLILLVAPYDTRPFESFDFIGANDGASGPALLLELARDLSVHPLPYTTRIVFLDGEAPRSIDDPEGALAGEPDRELRLLGSTSLAGDLAEQGLISRARLLVFFNQVADADLRIARDLYSNRIYREAFWQAARRQGETGAFPPDRGFESVPGSHHPFREAGLRRVVAIVDTSYGGEEPPGAYADSPDDTPAHLAPESLRVVGEVALDALEHISRRLAKIDHFARPPLAVEAPSAAAEGGPPPSAADAPPEAPLDESPGERPTAGSGTPNSEDAAGDGTGHL